MVRLFVKRVLASVAIVFFAVSAFAVETTTVKLPKKAKKAEQVQRQTASESEAVVGSSATTISAPVMTENIALSEFAYQPGVGQSQLTVAPLSLTREYSVRRNQAPKTKTDFKDTVSALAVQYQRGFGENSSLRATTTIGDMRTSTKGSEDVLNSGLSNIDVTWQQVSGTGTTVQRFWGLAASISPSPMEAGYEFKQAGVQKSGTGNRFTGGHAFMPFVGTQSDRGNVILGGKGSLQVNMERTGTTKDSTGNVDISITGGNVLAAEGFVEVPRKNFMVGFKGGINFVSSYDVTQTQTATKTRNNFSRDASQYLKFGAYGQYRYNSRVEILPAVDVTNLMSSASGTNSLESQNDLQVGLAARIAL